MIGSLTWKEQVTGIRQVTGIQQGTGTVTGIQEGTGNVNGSFIVIEEYPGMVNRIQQDNGNDTGIQQVTGNVTWIQQGQELLLEYKYILVLLLGFSNIL